MLPLVNDPYESLSPYVPGKPVSETERELGITGCIKLASNENPYGTSPRVLQAIASSMTELHEYPDASAFYLKRRLAAFLGVAPEQLIIGNGSNEIIEIILRTCVRPNENVIYADPSFIVYKLVPQAMGTPMRTVPLRDMRYDLPAIAEAMDSQTKVVFIANPNNPTGTYVTHTELTTFLAQVPEHVLVVLDEAYFEYAVADDYPNGLALLSSRPRLMVLRTFSKAYGLAGLRVGYGVGPEKLVDYLNRGRQPFNVNTVGQIAATAALDDPSFVERCRRANRAEMARLTPALQSRGLRVVPSQANFLLVDFHRPAASVFGQLLQRGVIVRPMHGQNLPTCQRVTVGTTSQNDRLLAAIDSMGT